MHDTYDVVVAGAGPAGAQCARDLSARGYATVVLETESEEEFPRQSNKSTAGTFPSTMSAFGIPDDVVMNETSSVVIESPTDHYTRDKSGAVLDFADLKRWLVAEGRRDGVEYRFDSHVTGPVVRDGVTVGVEYNGSETVHGDIVIDATGPSAPLAEALGVTELESSNRAIGVEYELRGVTVDHPQFGDLTDAMMLRLDQSVAPGGYGWIFHTGGDTAKVGICYIQNGIHQRWARPGYTIDDYLQNWIESDPRLKDAERIEGRQHRGAAHIQLPRSLHTENFVAIGDTVPSVDPLWGEGISTCMQSGRAAATTVDDCLLTGDGSGHDTSVYERLWHSDVAPNVRRRFHMTRLLYRASNDRFDELVSDLRRRDDDLLKRANDGEITSLLRLFKPRDVSLVADHVSSHLSDVTPDLSAVIGDSTRRTG